MKSMEAPPRVTALIDTYNHERFIAEAIESVLVQDFPANEMEILVVDDGSTDATPEIVRRYAERVRYIRKENGGQASALNLGFAEARGEIVAMLDGDDVWLPQKVRRVMEAFAAHPEAGIVFHPYQYWFPAENRCEDDRAYIPVSGYLPDNLDALLVFGGVGTCSSAIRRVCAERVLPIPEGLTVLADAYLIAAAIFAAPAVGLKECLTKYRHHGANLTASASGDARRLARALECSRLARAEVQKWLEGHGFRRGQPAVETLLERMRLVDERTEFSLAAPSRFAFFAHLRAHYRLYSPLWKTRYRLFQSLTCFAGLLLGYRGYHSLQERFRNARSVVRLRKMAFPVARALQH